MREDQYVTGEARRKCISYDYNKRRYMVSLGHNRRRYHEYAKTLDEAVKARDRLCVIIDKKIPD